MFYSEAILSRRGPLGKVWLAAHMERKLSKTQTLQTDIEESVDAIMGQEIEVMALRLSGQLLLGVVRIYSRKAKYLLDDCNEALLKIKMAFRPGVVDMTEDQLAVNKNAITLQAGELDLDLMMPDINWELDFEDRPLQHHGQHEARMADITLAITDDFTFNADDLDGGFEIGPSDGIGSQDFGEIDLNLDWGDGFADTNGHATLNSENDDQMSVEMGRDAPGDHESIASHILGLNGNGNMDLDLISNRSKTREASENPFGADMNIDLDLPDFNGMDLGDIGIGFDEQLAGEREKTPSQTFSRGSSPLTDVPLTPPPEEDLSQAIASQTPVAKQRKVKERKQIIDVVTELDNGVGSGRGRGNARDALGPPVPQDVSSITTEQRFLPRSTVVMRLLEIRHDPVAHFLPTKVTPGGSFYCSAPPGMTPELAQLFMRPASGLGSKRRGASPHKGHSKKARTDGSVIGEEDELEQPRRAGSRAPSMALNSDILARATSVGHDGGLDFGDIAPPMDDFQMDVPEFGGPGIDLPLDGREPSMALTDRSRMSTPAVDGLLDDGEDNYADASCPIALFDQRPATQSQVPETSADPVDNEGKGYSKNTVKALSIIRKELRPVPEAESQEKTLSFQKMSDKASRRAAASFFFELLFLSTRDCIKVSQAGAFQNIEVRAKDKLWERQSHDAAGLSQFATPSASRAPSVARSLASSLGL
ncbi:hypothetical protein HGRIS_002437 [Hohenbuehelia grisea]|uniref:Double-strand-break repair protein rad21 n=1 Tax=Hohenbuehelia grisea TaxID=104357 RepID=A0ABR3JKG5_9AGAR